MELLPGRKTALSAVGPGRARVGKARTHKRDIARVDKVEEKAVPYIMLAIDNTIRKAIKKT